MKSSTSTEEAARDMTAETNIPERLSESSSPGKVETIPSTTTKTKQNQRRGSPIARVLDHRRARINRNLHLFSMSSLDFWIVPGRLQK
jgi:hypothetical protein